MATQEPTSSEDEAPLIPDEEQGLVQPRRVPMARVTRMGSLWLLPGMKVLAHEIQSNGSLLKCEMEEALAGTAEKAGNYWIDIDADDRDVDELMGFLEQLELPSFLTASLASPVATWSSQVIALRSTSLSLVRILPASMTKTREIAHAAALSVPHLLVTFTSCPRYQHTHTSESQHDSSKQVVVADSSSMTQQALEFLTAREKIPGATSSGALLAWLMFHVDRTAREMRMLRHHVLEVTEQMDQDETSISLDEIVASKERLLQILSVAEEQTETLESLSEAATDTDALDFANLNGTIGVLLATARSSERSLLRLEKRIADLRQSHESLQQDRINRRLAVLTVLSAIFLPLTLMAGIYGMNFENMPELGYENAYYLLLGAMGLVAIIMLCFFWRAGWFYKTRD